MIIENKEVLLYFDKKPVASCQTAWQNLPEERRKEILAKPYICGRDVSLHIFDKKTNIDYYLDFKKGYRWDGASIPKGFRWILGAKGKPSFLIPSMVHDMMCEKHGLVGYNRHLSSVIFRELLIAAGVNKFKATIMFYAVDNFQRLINWKKNKKDNK